MWSVVFKELHSTDFERKGFKFIWKVILSGINSDT